ncbi:MAG: site-specific integrase [Dialister sp.]|nr:site-specific integrase [Dialister sp.]
MSEHFYIRDIKGIKSNQELSQKSLDVLSDIKALSTINAYESDWNDFCDWCKYKKVSFFPATPETIVNYINDLADYAKTSTIRRRISAISENFNSAGLSASNPCRDWLVRETLIGLTRIKGAAQKGKTPVYWDELRAMIGCMDLKTLAGVRDKAILLTGFMGAFRRSEIAGLNAEDIARLPQGIIISVTRSKTDQEQKGQQVAIPYISDKTMCAITALNAWVQQAHISSGPLFRSILKNGKVSERRLSDKTINLLVKKYASLIGLNPDLYGAHSLRHGFATYAALHGVEERLIMKQTRHRSVEMVRHYINEADLFSNNAISLIFGNPQSTNK